MCLCLDFSPKLRAEAKQCNLIKVVNNVSNPFPIKYFAFEKVTVINLQQHILALLN